MEEHAMEQQSVHWTEAWLRTAIGPFTRRTLSSLASHRQRASIISEEAVMVGVIATLGLGAIVAFVTGLGGVLQKALAQISGQA
jgi:hypothetical protein